MKNRFILSFILCISFLSFKFPENHSFHSEYNLEWVYFVGHLKSETGATFGYELSFFRLALVDDKMNQKMEVYPVHFAISNPKEKTHLTFETRNRNIGGIAGYTQKSIFSGEYNFEIIAKNKFKITARPKFKNTNLELTLDAIGEPLIHGDKGLSIKSRKNPSARSYYYSYPRLNSFGTLTYEGKIYKIISGDSWMDHEWSENKNEEISFSSQNTSWDWICLMTEEGDDFISFGFQTDKLQEKEITGILRTASGQIHKFEKEGEIKMSSLPSGLWKSPTSKIKYPLSWKVEFPNGYWIVKPIFNEQEFNGINSTGIIYWEGMVEALGEIDGKKKKAKGYLELKGYEDSSKWWEF